VVLLMIPLMALWLARGVRGELAVAVPPVGPWRPEEKRVMAVFAVTALAWITRGEPFGGWKAWLDLPQANDASVALLAVILLCLLPNGKGGRLLGWERAVEIPWGVLLLFGGDLYTLILSAGSLEVPEADCYFKQLMRGVEYMHEMGVAHRDLKPENLLLTSHGALKITDFGNAECFRMAWEAEAHMTAGLCGSAPYIAPEEYVDEEFDPRAVDVWACGVIYMAMRTGRHLWRVAQKGEDEFFTRYLEDRREESGFRPIEVLRRVSFSPRCLRVHTN